MPLRRLLRILIVAEVAFWAVAAACFYFSLATFPPALRSFIESQSQAETCKSVVTLALNIPLGIAALIARIGLFFFWRPARALFLIQVIVGTLLLSFGKPLVMTSLAFASESTGVGCVGAIIVLIYYSPLKEYFEKPKTPPNERAGGDGGITSGVHALGHCPAAPQHGCWAALHL